MSTSPGITNLPHPSMRVASAETPVVRRSEPDDSVPFDQDRRGFDGDPAGAVDHPGADHGESVDFSRARNISHVEGLPLESVILPTGLSTAVHNLHAVQGGPRRRLGSVTDRGDLPDHPED